MGELRNIRSLSIVIILMATNLSAQSLSNFLGTWTGIESLDSPTNSYENRNISITIMEGGDRDGFLIYNSSSDFLFNDDLDWAYHYFGLDKNTNELIFLRRFITPIGLLGNQELRYDILEWNENSFLAEYTSDNGNTFHQLRMNLNTLDVDDLHPVKISLHQNYPNPFNPSTTISVDIEMGKSGTLIIYNLTGQSVKTLYQGNFNAGLSKFQWNGRDKQGKPVSTGTYIYRLVIDGFSQSQKMVLLK